MKLRTQEVLKRLPSLGSQTQDDPIAQVKFFTPDAGRTWYATEGSPEGDDFIFYGFVQGVESEWGNFALSEIQSIRGRLGMPVERDRHFHPRPMSQVVK
jgi:hypothetical protein